LGLRLIRHKTAKTGQAVLFTGFLRCNDVAAVLVHEDLKVLSRGYGIPALVDKPYQLSFEPVARI
jgi:hypothetical protein